MDIAIRDDVPDVCTNNVRSVHDQAPRIRREWILEQLDGGKHLKARHVADQFDCSMKTAYRDLGGLTSEGIVEFVRGRAEPATIVRALSDRADM